VHALLVNDVGAASVGVPLGQEVLDHERCLVARFSEPGLRLGPPLPDVHMAEEQPSAGVD
jgi:hypothetical protein